MEELKRVGSLAMKLFLTLVVCTFLAVLAVWAMPLSSGTHAETAELPVRTIKIGQAFNIPYRLTETNHLLIRVRIDGKGPFNFLIDSGAPAIYVATETASKAGLKPVKERFWTPIHQLDLEGGATLTDINARIEDPFQLVGMNALGLPGTTIDGILGFTVLARFRLEIDPTRDFMTWTLLDHIPPDPPIPHQGNGKGRQPPRELQALSALGPLAKGLAFLIGKEPEEERFLRGFLGLEWSELPGPGAQNHVQISQVLKGSPADRAGLCAGDRILRIRGHLIDSLKTARSALARTRADDSVELFVERDGKDATGMHQLTITVTAGEGF